MPPEPEGEEPRRRRDSGDSSSLDYLAKNEGGEDEKEDADISSKKRPRDWAEK